MNEVLDQKKYDELVAYVGNLPSEVYAGIDLKPTVDNVVDNLLNTILEEKRYRTMCKRTTFTR